MRLQYKLLMHFDKCTKAFLFEPQLAQHKILYYSHGMHQCMICKAYIQIKIDLTKHVKAHDFETYSCDYCTEYSTKDNHNLHTNVKNT